MASIKYTNDQILKIKKAVGIDTANCEFCICFGTEDDGGEPESSVSWPVCHDDVRIQNLKSFPFKKDMKCWAPEFWGSKFPSLIKIGDDGEVTRAINEFNKAIELAIKEEL